MRCSTSRGVKSTSRLRKLKRTPRTPALSIHFSSSSVTSSPTKATPLALPFEASSASTMARLSLEWHERLHDHVLVEAEKIAQREQLFLRRVARRVFALRRIGKFRLRPEHMAMRIDRARRRLEFRLRRIGMERDVTRRHRHAASPLNCHAREGGFNPDVTDRRLRDVSSPAPATRPGRRRRTWWRARACRRAFPSHAPPSASAARPTCRADGRARWRRHAD